MLSQKRLLAFDNLGHHTGHRTRTHGCSCANFPIGLVSYIAEIRYVLYDRGKNMGSGHILPQVCPKSTMRVFYSIVTIEFSGRPNKLYTGMHTNACPGLRDSSPKICSSEISQRSPCFFLLVTELFWRNSRSPGKAFRCILEILIAEGRSHSPSEKLGFFPSADRVLGSRIWWSTTFSAPQK